MKNATLKFVALALLTPAFSYGVCHQECIPPGPWESACPICNYQTRTPPDCSNSISEHSGCDYDATPDCALIRNPVFGSPGSWVEDPSSMVPDCSDTSPGC